MDAWQCLRLLDRLPPSSKLARVPSNSSQAELRSFFRVRDICLYNGASHLYRHVSDATCRASANKLIFHCLQATARLGDLLAAAKIVKSNECHTCCLFGYPTHSWSRAYAQPRDRDRDACATSRSEEGVLVRD